MDAASAVSSVLSVQNIFQSLATALTMTAYLFPPQAQICDNDCFDYIVVGAGSAGSIIATRLAEDPDMKVLLIEAGGDPPLESILPAYDSYLKKSKNDWNYTSVREETQKCHKNGVAEMTRGKMLGGCSSNNFMEYVRGSPVDYDTWAAILNDETWNYDHVLPYFKKSEKLTDKLILNSPTGKFHGTKGNVGVIKQNISITHKYLDAFKELGYDIILDNSGTHTLGFLEPLYNIYDGVRQSTAYCFLGPNKNRPNLHVAKNTLVTRIIIDENNNAIGVEAITEDNTTISINANKEVIVSAGTINSPQLLMLSGIGPKEHLNKMKIKVIVDLSVGKNLQDHPTVIMVHRTDHSQPEKPTNPHDVAVPIVAGFVALNKSQIYADYETASMVVDRDSFIALCAFYFSFNNSICEKMYEESEGKEMLHTVMCLLSPESRGRVLLRSTDPKDHPLISLGTYTEKSDLKNIISYMRNFNEVMETSFFRRVKAKFLVPESCENLEPGCDEYWECLAQCMVTNAYHYVGTCAMGSVVDSRLRVYGVKRLRVADGSVMPLITKGNPNVPIMMIGEKAADMIKEDNKNKCY